MEEGRLRKIISPILERKNTINAIETLKAQVDLAENAANMRAAKSPLVRAAIKVIETFLRKTGRICYGGQAINAHLPDSLKFYDTKKTIPDYDVYTPALQKDLQFVLTALRREGFPEVAYREGLHEGTLKISVAYNDILDLTAMDTEIYSILYKRSKEISGIHYADANFLRSNMYKELAQPEGEIDRWEKVYTRLVLLNEAVPTEKCGTEKNKPYKIPNSIYEETLQFIINNNRILAGAWLDKIYKKKTKNYTWLLDETEVPLIFYSPSIEADATHLQSIIGSGFSTKFFEGHGDVVPACVVIYVRKTIVAILVDESSCNSYNKIRLTGGREVNVASLDTAIRLFYQLGLLRSFPPIAETSIHCVAQNLVDISMKIRNGSIQNEFPLFSIECSGHQKTKGSLLREKRLRAKIKKLTRKMLRKRST